MIDLIPKLVFFAVAALFGSGIVVFYARARRRSESIAGRLGKLQTSNQGDALFQSQESASELMQLLATSGLSWTVADFVGRAIVAALAGLAFGAIFGSLFMSIAFALLGFLVVWTVVDRARTKRLALVDEQMPQALEIMALGLRAGHPLPKALALASEEAPSPIAEELRRAVEEHKLGRPLGEVLAAFGARLPNCEAVNTFVVAVLVLQDTGGNLIAVIDRIVETARARAGYRARLRALTAEGRQSARLLSILPGGFACLAMLSDPSYAETLFVAPQGRVITFIAFGLWIIGVLWIRKLTRPLT